MAPPKILWYFADPMCSWCWGFAPVITALVEKYRGKLAVSLVVGGLRAGSTAPMSAPLRDEILHHWHQVQRLTGQPFRFEGVLPEGFVYDTEPACRAAVTIPELNPTVTFAYFQALQSAFYAAQRDITQEATLVALAGEQGVDALAFREAWRSEAIKAKTRRHFQMTRAAGVTGFPTAVLQDGRGYRLLTQGYRPLEALEPAIDQWLSDADP